MAFTPKLADTYIEMTINGKSLKIINFLIILNLNY